MIFNIKKNNKAAKQIQRQNTGLRSLSMGMATVIAVSITLLSTNAMAKSTPELDAALDGLMPGTKPDSIEESALPGLYEVSYGSTIFYFNKDASLMFRGDIIDVNKRVNLTENKRGEARSQLLKSMDESKMIVYPAENEINNLIFVDDNKKNVDIAGSLGMTGIHFKSANQLRTQLKEIGIQI